MENFASPHQMSKSSFLLPLRWLLLSYRRQGRAGFTLLELLVALIMGSIIVSTLLFAVVGVLQANQKEDSRAETQRDIQTALDYISTDLREAVFVYDGSCLTGSGTITVGTVSCPGVVNFLPAAVKNSPSIPVLAFWRIDELPPSLIQACNTNATSIYNDPPPTAINGVPCLSRRNYTLVVYYLDPSTTGNWKGKARIRRYELPQFAADGTRNTGWVDPTLTANNFLGWPFDVRGNNLQAAATLPDGSTNLAVGNPASVTPDVLVDFVDDPTNSNTATASCPPTASTTNLPDFVLTPSSGSKSFYACVRGGGITPATSTTSAVPNNPGSRNQEIAVFIRGNAAGRAGVPSTAQLLFEMETRALTRSSYEKSPSSQ